MDEKVRLAVNAFLSKQQKATLKRVGIDQMMIEVRLWVPEVKGLSNADLRTLVVGYYVVNHLQLEAAAPPTGTDDEIKEAIKDAVATASGDPVVVRDGQNIKISITGVTANRIRNFNTASVKVGFSGTTVGVTGMGGDSASFTVGWDGTLSVAFSQDNFYLTTSLSKTKWEVK